MKSTNKICDCHIGDSDTLYYGTLNYVFIIKISGLKRKPFLSVPIVEILNATTFTSLRSMASKLVPSEEMGGNF